MESYKKYILLIFGIWIGLVLGLSFIEAPLKFQAPGITTKLGLGIGRLVFGTLNKIEIIFSILLLLLHARFFKNLLTFHKVILMLLGGIVCFQSIYLLPYLNLRVDKILDGENVVPSYHHILFIILEVLKLISLFMLYLETYPIKTSSD